MAKKEFPVYLFTGFLDAGKTRFIQGTLEDKRFNNGENTLLLLCEEGVEELDASRFSSKNVFICIIENMEDITPAKLESLAIQYKAKRAMIEYNGMWPLLHLYNNIPDYWVIYQNFLFINSTDFIQYNANMRSLVVDKVTYCDIVIFNRFSSSVNKLELHKICRAISRGVQIAYEYIDGHAENDDIEDPLPFDINAAIVTIKDDDYAIWYRDVMDETEKYNGKIVHFKGIVARNDKLPPDSFVVGRHIMTCCVEDIAYCGIVCLWSGEPFPEQKQWVEVTAKLENKYLKLYGQKGPVLTAIKVNLSTAPDKEVATFY